MFPRSLWGRRPTPCSLHAHSPVSFWSPVWIPCIVLLEITVLLGCHCSRDRLTVKFVSSSTLKYLKTNTTFYRPKADHPPSRPHWTWPPSSAACPGRTVGAACSQPLRSRPPCGGPAARELAGPPSLWEPFLWATHTVGIISSVQVSASSKRLTSLTVTPEQHQ